MIGGIVWVYNTYENWQKQIRYISVTSIRQAAKRLEKRRITIYGTFNKLKIDKTKWYTIEYSLLERLYVELKGDLAKKDEGSKEENKVGKSYQSMGKKESMSGRSRQSSYQNRTARLDDFGRPIPETTLEINTDNYEEKDKKIIIRGRGLEQTTYLR